MDDIKVDMQTTFAVALQKLQTSGGIIRIGKWSPDVFISIQKPDSGSKNTAPYLYVSSRNGRVPWIPTQIEMLTEKWLHFPAANSSN